MEQNNNNNQHQISIFEYYKAKAKLLEQINIENIKKQEEQNSNYFNQSLEQADKEFEFFLKNINKRKLNEVYNGSSIEIEYSPIKNIKRHENGSIKIINIHQRIVE